MEVELINQIENQISETKMALELMASDIDLKKEILAASLACRTALQNGKKILLAGNGGSAADAQHIAAEFVNYFNFDRPGLPAIALTTDTSVITSISNDSDFDKVFARQLQAIGNAGDVFFAYSTSGTSKNIISALKVAKTKGLVTVGFTGLDTSIFSELCDFMLCTPSSSTPKIQEGHLVMGHILSGLVEQMMFAK